MNQTLTLNLIAEPQEEWLTPLNLRPLTRLRAPKTGNRMVRRLSAAPEGLRQTARRRFADTSRMHTPSDDPVVPRPR
jgi:hypothetical protein